MSLSLLNAYNSSDESEDDELAASKPVISESSGSLEKTSDERKNFFVADDSDSSDEEDTTALPLDDEGYTPANIQSMTTPSGSMYSYESANPVYGPPHPSQLYNYAAYNQDYGDASTSLAGSDEHGEQPSTKRQRVLTDEDARKLIKKHEAEAWDFDLPSELNIIDANVDSHLGNVRENILKNITSTTSTPAALLASQSSSSKDGKKPGGVAKRKNQITYLAYMAKANEEKLQNEWAKNRLTKRQTQAKYGF